MWDAEVDIAVVGAGGCGLTASLAAAQKGVEIAVFEKTDFILGNTAASAGMIPAAGTQHQKKLGVIDTPKIMAEDIMTKNNYKSDQTLTLELCKESSKLIEWMEDTLAVDFSLVKEFKYPGHSNLRMHAPPSRSGEDLIKQLKKKADSYDNLYIIMKSEVQELIIENNEIVGVHISSNKETQNIKAKKVILATNGFGGSRQMVKQYIPEIAQALYFGYDGNTGDGIEMGLKVGASADKMKSYQAHSAINKETGILVTWGTMMMGGFMTNKNGHRFSDETQGYSEFAAELLKESEQYGFMIFDEKIHNHLLTHKDFKILDEMNAFKVGNTIEELGQKLKLNKKNLSKTFRNFQRNKNEHPDEFNRSLFAKNLQAPFYGVKVVPALFHTQGGLKINTKSQVLNKKNEIIENLYAGGGAAVSISGDSSYGYMSGNGLLTALALGKIAGEHASQSIKGDNI